MDLERLTAVIRPRNPWEGLDLGFALARRWFPSLWGLWWITALPAGALAALWLQDRPDIWIIVAWWLKPVYEAPLLFWLSRTLFSEPMGLRALWRERRRVLPLRLTPYLLWRRFTLTRSFQLPLVLLEGTERRDRRRRQRVLQGTDSSAAWLTIICFHLESVLWLSAVILIAVLIPDGLPRPDPMSALMDIQSAAYWGSALLYWLAMSVLAPFYVAAGFASYLTRRTELEAWDLELEFRRAGSETQGTRRTPGGIVAILLVAVLVPIPSKPAFSQPPSVEQAREIIADVLAGEDFGFKRETETWVYVGDGEGDNAGPELPIWLRELLRSLANGATLGASVLKWTIILAAAVAAVVVARRVLVDAGRWRLARTPHTTSEGSPLEQGVFTAEPPPANAAEEANRLCAEGDLRGALSLLYRASLFHLGSDMGTQIPKGATEQECLDLAKHARAPGARALFERLTLTWLHLAYAHREPTPEEITDLVRSWQIEMEGGREI